MARWRRPNQNESTALLAQSFSAMNRFVTSDCRTNNETTLFFTEDNPAKGKPAPFFFNLLYGVEENESLACEPNSKPIRHALDMSEASRGDVRKPANQLLTIWYFYTDFPRPFFFKKIKNAAEGRTIDIPHFVSKSGDDTAPTRSGKEKHLGPGLYVNTPKDRK